MAPPARPIIGINADFVPANRHSSPEIRTPVSYCDAVFAGGGLPVLLPPAGKERDIDQLLDRLDGILLTGGLDLDPRRQGLTPSRAVQVMPARREDFDRALSARAIDRELPMLGVGLGMQELNVVLGGSLYLHLPDDQPRAMPHRDTSGPHRHALLIEPDTRLEEIYGPGEIRVNSDHHQAVRLVAPRLKVSARAPDGVIEAVEAAEPGWFCIGVQWHPESDTASALDRQLFESFVQACVRPVPVALAA